MDTITKKLCTDRSYVMAAFSLLCILTFLYMYFVSASVLHVVMQQEMQRKVSLLHTEISQLESEYISAQHSLSSGIANLDGYVNTEAKIFIHRADPTLVLSENTDITN